MKNLAPFFTLVMLAPCIALADEHSEHSGTPPGMKTDFAAAPPKKSADIPKGAKVFFKNLRDGQTISTKYLVKFGVRKMSVHPAGELKDGTGHFHLIIDNGPVPGGVVVPADEKHIHFGKAQIEYEMVLKPGEYKLTLQFADGAHVSYGVDLAETVAVTVK